MILESYKLYLTVEINVLKNKLEIQKTKLRDIYTDNLDTLQKSYIEKIIKEYTIKHNIKGIKKIQLKRKKIIKEIVLEYQKNRIKTKIKKLESMIKELTETKNSIEANKFIKTILENKYSIEYLFKFAIIKELPALELNQILLELFKTTTINTSTISNLQTNIIGMYKQNKIDEKININALLFFYQKLFNIIFPNQNCEITLYIELFLKEIELEFAVITNNNVKKIKKELEIKKTIIDELKKYIKNDKIINPIEDTEKFETILKKARFDDKTIKYLSAKMKIAYQEKKEEDAIKEKCNTVKPFLKNEDFIIFQKAIFEYKNKNEKSLITEQIIQDIISLCIYMQIELEQKTNNTKSTELLTLKINYLKHITNTKLQEKKSDIYYYCKNNNYPNILLDIERFDVTEYPTIYKLLNRIKTTHKKQIQTSEDVNIYTISKQNIRLYFAQINNNIIIINIEPISINPEPKEIPKEIIESLKNTDFDEQNKISSLHKDLTLIALNGNPSITEMKLTLKNKNHNQ